MTISAKWSQLSAPHRRYVIYVVGALLLTSAYVWRTWWTPTSVVESVHYEISATAEAAYIKGASQIAESFYDFYRELHQLPKIQHAHLQVRLYATRAEMHSCNIGIPRWAEGFYLNGVTHQYQDNNGRFANYDSLVHESVHQFHRLVADMEMPQWADEGLACFASSISRGDGRFEMDYLQKDAYPVIHIPYLGLTGDRDADFKRKRLYRLQHIVRTSRPSDIGEKFNLYYVHWFSLVHYLMIGESGKHRAVFLQYVKDGAAVDQFETVFGSMTAIESKWYTHLYAMQQHLLN